MLRCSYTTFASPAAFARATSLRVCSSTATSCLDGERAGAWPAAPSEARARNRGRRDVRPGPRPAPERAASHDGRLTARLLTAERVGRGPRGSGAARSRRSAHAQVAPDGWRLPDAVARADEAPRAPRNRVGARDRRDAWGAVRRPRLGRARKRRSAAGAQAPVREAGKALTTTFFSLDPPSLGA